MSHEMITTVFMQTHTHIRMLRLKNQCLHWESICSFKQHLSCCKMTNVCPTSLPAIWDPAGITAWPKDEIEGTDIEMRKLLAIHGGFHLKFSTWDCTPSKRGVRIRTTVQDETIIIWSMSGRKPPVKWKSQTAINQWRRGHSWREKLLHEVYHKQKEGEADINKSYQWLEKAGLKKH